MPCMDAVNDNYMKTISMVKRYRPTPANMRKTKITSHFPATDNTLLGESAAIRIQALVRRHQACNR